jgi:hypothetical protein
MLVIWKKNLLKTPKLRKKSLRDRVKQQSWKRNLNIKQIILYILYLITFICTSTIFWLIIWSRYFVTNQISFHTENIQYYSAIEVYETIYDSLIEKHIFWLLLWINQLEIIKQKYPFIQKIDLQYWWRTHIKVHITFATIPLVYHLKENELYIASYQEHFMYVQRNQWIMEKVLLIQLPEYINSIEKIQWIYSRFSEQALIQALTMIHDSINQEEILSYQFIPWNAILILTLRNNKELIFSLRKNINLQLIKWLDLVNYHIQWEQYNIIDLWSNEHIIVK